MLQTMREMTVTLTLDDGTELECVVLTIFEAADKEYIALLPLDGNEAEDGEGILIPLHRDQWNSGYPEHRERRGVRDRC